MEVNKDAVCIVVMPKIGLVYIPGMLSKETVLAGIYRKCRNSLTLNVNINKSKIPHRMRNRQTYLCFYHISVYTDIVYTVFDNGSGNTPILSC